MQLWPVYFCVDVRQFGPVIRHSPAERYIQYLLVHPDGYSTETIIQLLRQKHLDFIGYTYIETLRKDNTPPAVFKPMMLTHKTSSRFLMSKRVYYLFHPDKATHEALAILEHPKAKELVEVSLITEDAVGVIAHRLRSMGVRISTVEAIERYRFFFFDLSLVDTVELQALLRLRHAYLPPGEDRRDLLDQRAALTDKKNTDDPRLFAVNAPIKPLARTLNKVRLGYIPSDVDMSRLVKLAEFSIAAQLVQSLQGEITGYKAETARDLTIALKNLKDIREDLGSADEDLQKELQSLALRTEERTVPNINQLSGGNHTVDMMPTVVQVEGETLDE